jgi:glycosyltransferase involved in cell wall biosynthesis
MSDACKRLAIFLPTLVGGGAERSMINLAVGLAGRGYAVDFVLAQCEGAFMAQFPDTVRLVELNRLRLKGGRSIRSFPALVRYMRNERPIALITALHANVFAVWAKRIAGIPVRLVLSEQNTFSMENQELPPGLQQVMVALVRWTYPHADVVSAVSEGAADDLACVARMPRDRVQVIHNPIITPELAAKVRLPLDHPWFRPGEPPVILSVGRLAPQKDFPLLINAFARVRQSLPARLLILGEGPERAALTALIHQLGTEADVSLPGFVANPYPYMAGAAAFVLPSRWEGLPTVLAEALFCGAPTISTDCPSGPREILRDGKFGKLVPMGDVEMMAQAIYATLDGQAILPPRESWEPYELGTVVDEYLRAIQCHSREN